jgi:hypothetical protein
MFVVIHHNIKNPQQWEAALAKVVPIIEQGRLPRGVQAVSFLPCTDGRRADCLWEADTVQTLKAFLEPLTGTAADNDYLPINAEHAMGLPVTEPVRKAA